MDPSNKSLLSSVTPQQVVAILSLVGGFILLQLPALQSRRSGEAVDKSPVIGDDFKFSASAIEDPLAALRSKTIVNPDSEDFNPSLQVKAFTHWGFYTQQLLPRVENSTGKKVQVICVLMRPFLKAGFGEHRHRTRNAVVSALATAGYAPESPRTMYDCRLKDIVTKNESKFEGKWTLGNDEINIPFEWFVPSSSLPPFGGKSETEYSGICVLWCDFDEVRGRGTSPNPIDRTRKILYAMLTGYPRPKPKTLISDSDIDELPPRRAEISPESIDTAIFGPYDSSGLELMYAEAHQAEEKPFPVESRWIRPIRMASPFATSASKSIVIEKSSCADVILKYKMDRLLGGNATAKGQFVRIPITDDTIAKELLAELRRRGVEIGIGGTRTDESSESVDDARSGDIVLISEFDTSYGRNLPLNILDAAGIDNGKHQLNTAGSRWHWYTFTRGLDGRFGTAPDGPKPSSSDGPGGKSSVGDEPSGTNQTDALRRLAESLRELHVRRRREGKPGIVAVGVLGGDVFDKLLVLRALRPSLEDSLFFTNNLDAWFWDPQELPTTRNLIVASPFGLHLSEEWQRGVLPFRDSYQTSAYLAALSLAANLDGNKLEEKIRWEGVRLYEIGRAGPVDLSAIRAISPMGGQGMPSSSLQPESDLVKGPWPHRLGMRHLSMMIAFLLLFLFPILISRAYGDGRKGWNKIEPQVRPGESNESILLGNVAVVSGVAVVTSLMWQLQRNDGEVFSLWDGVSAWPWFAITLAAIAFSVLFVFRSLFSLNEGRKILHSLYFTGDPVDCNTSRWWQEIFPTWKLKGDNAETDDLEVEELWEKFSASGMRRYRVVRSVILTVVAMIALCFFASFLPERPVPVRGELARWLQLIVEFSATIAFVWLGALVFDAFCLNRKLIAWLQKGTSRWEPTIVKRHAQISQSKKLRRNDKEDWYRQDDLIMKADRDYIDLALVGDWTKDMGKLTSFPFLILALLLLARIPYFDDWSWFTATNLLFILVVTAVVVVAYRVHKAAGHLQKHALRSLCEEPPTAARDVLETRINSLSHGAFAPFYKQPAMEALFWLVSAMGVTGLWQAIARLVP